MSAATFEYRALDSAGSRTRGVTRAPSRVDAYRQISAAGLTPLWIRERSAGRAGPGSARDVAAFTHQLAVLVSARVPIGDGLRGIAEQGTGARLSAVARSIADRIESGERIADAMAAHENVFGATYIQTVRAAEHTGTLTKTLEYLGEMLDRSVETRQQIRSALLYPACVSLVLGASVVFLVGFAVPRFAAMFSQRGAQLPGFTRALAAVGGVMQQYWWALLAAAVVAGFLARRAWRRPWARSAAEGLMHRVPFLGTVLTGLAVARFSRVLGLCLSSGIGLIESLSLAGSAAGREAMRKDAETIARGVGRGCRLAEALPECTYVTPFARRMLASGEESGELPRLCSVVARHYERDSAALARNLATVIEPVLIVLIAMVVLVVALAIFLPMWDMVKLAG